MPKPFKQLPFSKLPRTPRRAHAYDEAEARQIVVRSRGFGSVSTHVRVIGRGPPMLCVHGLMTTGYSFRYMMGSLSERFRLYVPDLPGCGRSDKSVEGRLAPSALAQFLVELLDELGIERCHWLGNSMGGMVGLFAALDAAQRVDRMLCLHAPAVVDWRLRAMSRALRPSLMRRGLSRFIRLAPTRWAHKNVHYRDESLKSLEEAREYGAPLTTKAGADAFIKYLTETLDPDEMRSLIETLNARRQAHQAFPVPLLLLYATTDPMVSPDVGEALHRLIPSARFRWLENSSHFAHVDTPDEVTTIATAFFEDTSPRP